MTKQEFINHINQINQNSASKLDTWCFVSRSCGGKLNPTLALVEKNITRQGERNKISAEGIYNSLGKKQLDKLKNFNLYDNEIEDDCCSGCRVAPVCNGRQCWI